MDVGNEFSFMDKVLPRARARFMLLLLLCLVCGCVISFAFAKNREDGELRVVFFDVGQGDSIYIKSPTGAQVLIDGGPDSSVLRNLSRELGFFDRDVDVVIATHEDKDHVGGLPSVFRRYTVNTFVRTENQGESGAAITLDTLPKERGIHVVYARRGDILDLGGGAVLTILFPDRDPTGWETNTSSIVARLTYGDSEFLFTGDSPSSIEEYLVSSYGTSLQSDVLKLGHHGSRTSSSENFINTVRPLYAIVSAGKGNSYGHPHKETIETVMNEGAEILETSKEGSIVFVSDGKDPVHSR